MESNQENLSQELNMSRDKLVAAEQCKEMLRAQVVVLTNELNASNAKIETYLAKITEHTAKEKQHELEKEDLNSKFDKMKQEYDLKLGEANGSYFALKLAHTHLESKFKTIEQNLKQKYESETELYKENMEKMKQENDELRDRIKAGAKEYSKLMEKYHMIKNQQFNNDINVYHELNGGDRREFHKNHNHQIAQCLFRKRNPQNPETDNSDSAIQDRTMSQSVRASNSETEIENTLLNDLLSNSFYGWQRGSGSRANDVQQNHRKIHRQLNNQQQNQASSSSQITTSQPRIMSISRINLNNDNNNNNNIDQTPNFNHQQIVNSDLSDDGLIHADRLNVHIEKQKSDTELKQRLKSLQKEDENVFGKFMG